MSYTKEAIIHLIKFINGDKDAQIWLLKNNFKELELLCYALKGYDGALTELTVKKYFEVTAFVQAVKGNSSAFTWLVKNKKFEWAATVRVINKKKDALLWLKRFKLEHYAELGEAIRSKLLIENEGDFMGILAGWMRALKGKPNQALKKK